MIRRYMRPAELAEEFGVSPDFVRDIIRCIRVNIRQCTRYSPDDLISSGKVVSVRTAAYMDAARHRQFINTDMEQYIPTYDPISTEIDLHLIEPQTVDIEGITEQVIRNIKTKLMAM